jgi:class 3 adenylate cyclase
MFTDVAGYTALMQQDEEAARDARLRHREAVEAAVSEHGGDLIQFLGDGSLSIFPSAVEAVTAGMRIQQRLQSEPALPLRVGIHQGEIAYDDQGAYGDSVNVASRIESLGVPGSVLISAKVFDEIKNHPTLSAVALGDVPLKNVAQPVRVYAVCGEHLIVPGLEELAVGSRSVSPAVETLVDVVPRPWSIQELLRRRVPQLFLAYLGLSWAMVEALDWLAGRYGLAAGWVDGAIVLLVSWVPSVLLVAYFHGGPGRQTLTRAERIGVPVNFALSIIALLIVFRTAVPADSGTLVGTTSGDWTPAAPGGATPAGEEAPRSRSDVAIFPFTVRGSEDEVFLREALLASISRNLDGAGEIRSIDHRDLLGYLESREPHVPLTRAYASTVGRYFGARYLIMGEVFQTGSENLRISADLYDRENPSGPPFTARAQGTLEEVFEMADALSIRFLERLGAAADGLPGTSGAPTSSMDARRAVAQGDTELRAARYSHAVDAYQRAVALDSAYAEAWYRLSLAAEFDFQFSLAKAASRQAVGYAGRLSERDRLLLRGWDAFLKGDVGEAEDRYRQVLTRWPQDRQAQYGLAEVLFHFNSVRGRPRSESEPLLKSVIEVNLNHGEARYRLLEFAAERDDRAWFDSLSAGIDPQADQAPVWMAVRAFAWGSEEERRAALTDLRNQDPLTIGLAAGRVASARHDFETAERFALLLAEPRHGEDWEALGLLLAAQSSLASGRWSQAQRYLQDARSLEDHWSLELEALYWSLAELSSPAIATDIALPHTGAPSQRGLDDANRLLLELDSWDPAGAGTDFVYLAVHNGRHLFIRDYVTGLISLEVGSARVEDLARQLETARASEAARAFARSLGRSLRARAAWRKGDLAGALNRIERNELRASAEEKTLSPFFALAHDRYLRAELLRALGRHEEALPWYRSLSEGYDFVYTAPACLGEARTLEALGQRSLSAAAYGRFAELWSDADPAGRALVEAALRKAEELTSESR